MKTHGSSACPANYIVHVKCRKMAFNGTNKKIIPISIYMQREREKDVEIVNHAIPPQEYNHPHQKNQTIQKPKTLQFCAVKKPKNPVSHFLSQFP